MSSFRAIAQKVFFVVEFLTKMTPFLEDIFLPSQLLTHAIYSMVLHRKSIFLVSNIYLLMESATTYTDTDIFFYIHLYRHDNYLIIFKDEIQRDASYM
jgi:hypothetical protein